LNVILIYYAMDFSKSQKMYFLKNLVKHLKIIVIFLIYLITSWLEIGNGKKCCFQCNLNIHILSQFVTTLEKDFEKGL
jgi:hypothetical protein